MKRVSFKVAKALKEAGYPKYGLCDEYYDSDGHVVDKFCHISKLVYPCPTYLEVWLWLWREKKYLLELTIGTQRIPWCRIFNSELLPIEGFHNSDPEEVIIAAIEYLVINDLIK